MLLYSLEFYLMKQGATGEKIEYRQWNPFRSKLGAAILVNHILLIFIINRVVLMIFLWDLEVKSYIQVLLLVQQFLMFLILLVLYSLLFSSYLQEGAVYAVEFSHRPGRDLLNVAKTRTNIVPIIEDARHPLKYRILVPMVDTIFADVAQPDQARIVGLNAKYFLKNGGHCVISIKASCIDSTATPEAVFASEVNKLREEKFKPLAQLTLEPYERDHAVVTGVYQPNA